MKRLLITFFVIGIAGSLNGEVIENTNISLVEGGPYETTLEGGQSVELYSYNVSIVDPISGGPCFSFDWHNGGILLGGVCLHVDMDFFEVEYGDALVVGASSTGFPDQTTSYSAGEEFYLGVIAFEDILSNEASALGWMHMRVIGPDSLQRVEMIGNAMAYGVPGIYVGTTRVVPEPSGAWMMLLGLLALFTAKSSRRERR